ncbi:PAS domain S-box protein [Paracnuella aquatica]|nr:PAS domain S-box protein [Paracnuella aquatica]
MTDPYVKRMLDFFPALFCVLDHQHRLVHVNKGALHLLGYYPSEITGLPLQQLLIEDDLHRTLAALKDLIGGVTRPGFVTHFRHKDGTPVPLSFYASVNRANNHIYGIGQRVPFADAGHQPAGNTIGLVKEVPAAELQVNASFDIISWNDAAEKLLEKSGAEISGSKFWSLLPTLQQSAFQRLLEQAMQQQSAVAFEFFSPILHQQWIEVTAFPAHGNLTLFIRNIHERKQSENELWKLSLIARETTNLVVLTDGQGDINWVNDAFVRVTGYTQEEAFGEPLASLLSGPETDNATSLQLQQCMKNGQPFRGEILQYDRLGKKLWLEMQCQPYKDETGKVEQFFSIQTNITQRKEFEEQLHLELKQRQRTITRATIEAQERERSLVSQELHDNVNQVLTTIKLYNELCLTGIDQKNELLRKSVELLQQSINEIRSLSKRLSAPTLGKFRLRDSVKELTDSIAATNRLQISTDLKLLNEIEVPQELHLAIYRILQEHFTNILKHSSAQDVQVGFEMVNDELVLKVRDDGKGFNTAELSGGIGIANMLTRAESLKGTLTLNSAPGLGCVLLASFPQTAWAANGSLNEA